MRGDDSGSASADHLARSSVPDDLGDVLREGFAVYPDGPFGESGGSITLYESVVVLFWHLLLV